MPDADGVAALRAARERNLDTPVILMTGSPSVPTAVEPMKLGALSYLSKPVPAEELLVSVGDAYSLARLARLRREAVLELGGESHVNADPAGLEPVFARAQAGLWMAYQPVVWARDGSRFGQEALLRTTAVAVPHPGAFLEIAERTSLDGLRSLRDVVARVRACGFRIAIDDLGAGYAALSSFASLEPDTVKLDMSLVRGIDAHPAKRRLVGAIAELCRDLGILVVAEGIETKEERDLVTELGCDLLQGYLLGRPTDRPVG